ncbi:hypothetical protein PpBr36_08058 [Pyricularia pennisetigena]|uniref:hypothetical protein n=1 Tax=Pyricularia pennisetigena TaxID=1578925 RepID=UPI00114E603E|nr:hypothetical protein PpBr36_08058 [Pyricularia pennisetigena]TLS24852.1 hypothetical protein PpBr36_08058 [Pyricularia pennisetigena]
MSFRPRRSAAQKATAAITNIADRDASTSSRSRGRNRDQSMDRPSSSASADSHHAPVTVKVPGSKLRQATNETVPSRSQAARTSGRDSNDRGKRASRGGKKRYVESEESEEEEEDVIRVGDQDADGEDDDMDVDAEGEEDDDMDVDAEGEEDEDADGDIDMDAPAPAIKVRKAPQSKPAPKQARKPPAPKRSAAAEEDDDEDDDELSELDSDAGDMDQTVMTTGGDDLGDEDAEGEEDIDAEGEEIEVAGEEEEEDDDDDEDDETGSREETPDLTKMTKRQQARFKDEAAEYMELSNEVQAKRTFTAEELSMRRAEMARRRRNLSEKRNEEVKMETINKLLKKQVRKENKKAAAGANDDDAPANEGGGSAAPANPMFVRWVSNKNGSRVSVPLEILEGPLGRTFGGGESASGKSGPPRMMVEEVS